MPLLQRAFATLTAIGIVDVPMLAVLLMVKYPPMYTGPCVIAAELLKISPPGPVCTAYEPAGLPSTTTRSCLLEIGLASLAVRYTLPHE